MTAAARGWLRHRGPDVDRRSDRLVHRNGSSRSPGRRLVGHRLGEREYGAGRAGDVVAAPLTVRLLGTCGAPT